MLRRRQKKMSLAAKPPGRFCDGMSGKRKFPRSARVAAGFVRFVHFVSIRAFCIDLCKVCFKSKVRTDILVEVNEVDLGL